MRDWIPRSPKFSKRLQSQDVPDRVRLAGRHRTMLLCTSERLESRVDIGMAID